MILYLNIWFVIFKGMTEHSVNGCSFSCWDFNENIDITVKAETEMATEATHLHL